MDKTFTNLKSLVNDEFTVEKVWGFSYKKWDPESKRMLKEDKWQEGYRKMYGLDTDKGSMDLSAGQFANLFEGVQSGGVADINGKTFAVKSNGKDGMDIRYYINPVRNAPTKPKADKEDIEERGDDSGKDEFTLADIPF